MKRSRLRNAAEFAAYLAAKGTVRALPHAAARSLGGALGQLAYWLDARHRRIAVTNLARGLPEVDAAARRVIARACYRHFGGAFFDALSATRFDAVSLCARLTLEGWERLEEAAAAGKGSIFMTAHFGEWEMAAFALGLYRGTVHVVGRPADNPWLDREQLRLRGRFGNATIEKRGAARAMLKVLHQRGRIGILTDQRAPANEGIWVPFLGHPAYTTPIVARLSLRTGAPVLPIFGFPLPGGCYRILVTPPIYPPIYLGSDGESAVQELTRRYLESAEVEIRARPELWLWMHERWKTPRGGSPPPPLPDTAAPG